MKKIRLATLLLVTIISACKETQKQHEEIATDTTSAKTDVKDDQAIQIPGVERLDSDINNLIDADAKIEILAEGFKWSEGPLWIADGDFVIFTDVPENTIYKWKEGEGKSIYLTPSGYTGEANPKKEGANGLLLDAEGQLVLCQHGDRRMAKMNTPVSYPRPDFVSLTEKFEGKKFNSPNDAAYHSDGSLYFTDPPYGLAQQDDDPEKEMAYQGVFRLGTNGNVSLLEDKLTRPNGIAFSPDYKTLYVANSDPKKAIWMAYDVKDDGSIDNGRVFFDATAWVKDKKGLPDGLKVDDNGYIYATGPGGVLVFNPDGKHLGTINTGHATANCAIGNDGHYLYMTASNYLMRIKINPAS